MPRVAHLLLCVLVLASAACGSEESEPSPTPAPAPPAPAEWVKPYEGWLPDTAPENTAVVRVVDGRTGAPIPGALVRRHLEMEMGPDGWGPSFEEARTDEYGIAVIKIVQERPWSAHWVAQAEGYGSDETYGVAPNEVVALLPGRAVHGRIVDALGRPAVDIPIGYKLGCGHAPEVFHTRTDADGRFVLRNIANNGDVAFSGPGILVDYYQAALRRLDETPDTHDANPAVRFEGRILGADVADLGVRIVHSETTARGVAAHIEDDGTFVLEGVARASILGLHRAPDGKVPSVDSGEFRRHAPLLWDVRKTHPAADEDQRDSDEQVDVRWRVLAPDGTAARPVAIHVYRSADGHEADFDSSTEDDHVLHLFPGTYEAVVGERTDRWVAPPVPFVVRAGTPRSLVIQATEQPRLVLQFTGSEPPENCWCNLAFAGPDGGIDHDRVPVETEFFDEYPVYLPPTAPARVRVRIDQTSRFFDVGAVADGRRVAVIDWPEPTVLRFQAPQDVTRVVVGGVEHEFTREARDIVVLTQVEGRVRLQIERWDDYRPTASGTRLIELPPAGGKTIRLEPLDYEARPPGQVTLLDVTGAPLANMDIAVTWFNPVSRELEDGEVETDARGVATSPLFRTGAHLAWNTHSRLDHGGPLTGPGPWTQRPGSARVVFLVTGPEGPLEDVAALFAGEVFRADNAGHDDEAEAGRFTFDQVPAGPQVLVVTAPGHRGEQRRIVLEAGEARTIKIVLAKR